MSAIRYSLICDETDSSDVKRAVGLSLVCLLISVLIHLAGFSIWQALDQDAGDKFTFTMVSDIPPMELTLVVNDPELNVETAEIEPLPAEPITDTGPVPWEQTPGDDSFMRALENLSLAEAELVAAEALARPAPAPAASEVIPNGAAADNGSIDPPISLEEQAPARKSYDTAIRMAINKNFIIPPAARSNLKQGQLIVFFTISRQGELLRIVVEESSGNASLDHAGLEAMRAATFPPLPPELAHLEQLDIRMTFNFEIVYRRSGK
ncbi:TonB family protein [Deltaproteobacteria bacterium OttesenSCG-928-K17]|nr:TonB family protein [Deltaproteobacteria bacterium OttesenSCG-928-K17]